MMLPSFNKKTSTLYRIVGLLLVIFILYGTTVEAAHKHGRLLDSKGNEASLTTDSSQKTAATTSGCNDCLICQLHQGFSSTLISLRVDDPPTQLLQRVSVSVPRDVLSVLNGTITGRAPPFIS
jgi:hypothetical protein